MVDQLEDYVIPRRDHPRGAAARRRRRLDRCGQVDAGQLAGRQPGDPARACCGRPPARRCSCTTPTTRRGSARTGCCPSWSGSTTRPPTPRRCSWCRGRGAAGPGDPRRSRRRLGRGAATASSPRSCWPPPTCGCSSPRPRATPTRCRGTSCARPPSALPRSRSCSTAPRRTPSRPSPPTWPGCWPAAGSRTRRCSWSTRGRSARTACCPPSPSPRSAAGCSRSPGTSAARQPSSCRPSTARSGP